MQKDREPRRSSKLPGTGSSETAAITSTGPDLGSQTSDNGIGEAQANTPLIPQPPLFDQKLIQALRENQESEKLSLRDARIINKFLRENGLEQKQYRRMDAKTKVATATDKIESRIKSYIDDADAYAKKKVEERGFTPQERFNSPFGPGDGFTVDSQKKAIRDRLLTGNQGAQILPAILEASYLREIRISSLEKWLSSNRLPDLYTFWAKSPEDIITESGVNTRIDDEDKERFLSEQDEPVPSRSIDEYANDIKELEANIPTDTVPGDTATQFTSFAKVMEARKHIRRASVADKDDLNKANTKLKDTFRILAGRRIVIPLGNGDKEDVTEGVLSLKTNGNGLGKETEKPGTTPAPDTNYTSPEPDPEPTPTLGENPTVEEPGSLRPNLSEKIKKMKEEAKERIEKFLETMEQRLRDEIPAEELQAALNHARMSSDDIDSQYISQLLVDLENKGLHIPQDIKNDLEEEAQEQVPKIDFAETLRSFISQLPKKDSARFLLETRYGKDLKNISQEEAKKVLDSLCAASDQDNTGEEYVGILSKAKKLLSGFRRKNENGPNRFKSEKSSEQPNFIDLNLERESIWTKAGKAYGRRTRRKKKETTPITPEEKSAKNRKNLKIVGGVLGIGAVVALTSLCIAAKTNNGNENSGQQASSQDTPTISLDRQSVLTAQAKATAKADSLKTQTATVESAGATTPAAPTTEPTTGPTSIPTQASGANQPTSPGAPSEPQGLVRSSQLTHEQAMQALDLTDGTKDGFVDVAITEPGSNFDNSLAQTLKASGLDLINKNDLYENGATRWKWTVLASDGDGAKYRLVYVGDRIQVSADKLADAYRWSNVEVPDKIATQVKTVSTKVKDHNKNAAANIQGDQQKDAKYAKAGKSKSESTTAKDTISANNIGGEINIKAEINVKNSLQNASSEDLSVRSNNETAKNFNETVISEHRLASQYASISDQKISAPKFMPILTQSFKQDDDLMRFIAAVMYQREKRKSLKKPQLGFYDEDDDDEDNLLLPQTV